MTTSTDGTAPLAVRDTTGDRGAELLDELDDLIATLDGALADQTAARIVIADAERRVAVLKERCRLHRAPVQVTLGDMP